jgi:tetratricopeptide (TPR) repeat protein
MVRICFVALLTFTFISCSQKKPIVETSSVDSVISNYRPSAHSVTAQQDLEFWEKRFNTRPEDLVNKQKYAHALLAMFHWKGDINDLIKADSLFNSLNQFYKGKEPGILLTLASNRMLRHQFKTAQVYIDSARRIIPDNAGAKMTWSDAQFELGNYTNAAMILRSVELPEDYGYNFRLSKLEHYNGSFDSSVSHMLKAASLARSPYLKQVAYSNAADLYLHEGKVEQAYDLYKRAVQHNGSDFHTLSAIGWIALTHDNNSEIANKIFRFIHSKKNSPDGLWRLIQANELSNTGLAKNYAREFADKVTRPAYGNMYAKYLVSVYTGLLNEPVKAKEIAEKELLNRATPQTYAWLCWALTCNGELERAASIYKQNVSGQPLEPLELFWMGNMMEKFGKRSSANKLFKGAIENKYDLSPAQLKQLEAKF